MTAIKHKILAKKLDIKYYFAIEYNVLNFIGIDLSSREHTLNRPWITWPTCGCVFMLMIGMAHFSWNHINELDLVTDALGPFVQILLSIWKCATFVFKRKELVGTVHRIWELGFEASDAELQIIARENKRNLRLCIIYCSFVSSAVLLALAVPLTVGTFNYLFYGVYVYKTPLTASYPLDVNNFWNYIGIYIWNIFGIHFVVCITVGVDALYSWCVNNLSAQFKVLQSKIDALAKLEFRMNPTFLHKSIVNCIKQHQRIMDLVALLNFGFWPIILAEFTLNAAQLCFIVYQIGRGLDMSRMPFLLSFMTTVLMQLLLYSHGGQYLENESENVALVCFESLHWQFWPVRAQKLLLLLILRAQKSCKMTAFFFNVNMRLFVWVLQTSVSYVALLWSVEVN